MAEKQTRPLCGTGVIILNKDDKMLIAKRKKQPLYGFPGGHLERYDSFEECAHKEIEEETGMYIPPEKIKFLGMMNIVEKENGFHYIDIYLVCRLPEDQTPKNMEPWSHEEWEWWSMEDIQKRKVETFYPIQQFLKYTEIFNLEHVKKLIGE